jgi:hypothetical protein
MPENKAGSGSKNEYEVGYGKPPKSTQFKKGVSGNPTGRPHQKHSPSQNHDVGETFRKVFAIPVKATVGGETRYINGTEAAFLQLRAKLSAGDLSAVRIFLYLCKHFDVARNPVNFQLKGLFDALMAGPVDTPKA